MEFAITFKGDISPKRTVALARQAELAGFTYAWFFDSHVLWRECYVTMAMCMEHTETLRFGPGQIFAREGETGGLLGIETADRHAELPEALPQPWSRPHPARRTRRRPGSSRRCRGAARRS